MLKIKILLTIVISLSLFACSNELDEDELKSLDVELETPTESISTNQMAEFTAYVSSNGEAVENADEVMFEILDGEESLDMIEAESKENGLYTIEYLFDSPGEYTVISHVEAFQLHTMPQKNVTVE